MICTRQKEPRYDEQFSTMRKTEKRSSSNLFHLMNNSGSCVNLEHIEMESWIPSPPQIPIHTSGSLSSESEFSMGRFKGSQVVVEVSATKPKAQIGLTSVVESQTPVYPEVSRYLRAVTSKSLPALQPPDTTFEKSKEQPIKQTTGQQISEVKSSPCIVGKKCLADGVRKTPSSLEDISEGACHKEILSTERTGTPVLVSSSDNSFKSSSNEDVPLHRYKTALVGSSSFQMMSQFSRSRSPDKESNSSLEDNVFSAESLKQAPVGSSSQFQPPTSLLQDDSRSLTGFEGSVDQDDTSVVASYPRNVLEGQNPVFPEGSRDLHTVTSKSLQALQPSDTTFENSKQQPIKQTTGQQIGEVMPPPCIVEEKCLAAGVRKTPSSLEDISGGACHKEILSTEQTGAPVLVSSSNEDVPQSCYKTALVGSSSFQIMSQFSRSRSPDKGSNSSLEDNDVSSASKGNLHEGELFPTLETREGTLVSGLDELESPSSSKEERSESSLHLFEDRPLPEGAKSVPNLLKRSQTGSLNDLISKSSLLLKAEVSQTLSSQVDPVVARAVMEQSCSQAALEHRELESESRATFSMKRSDSLSSFEDQLSSEGVKSAGTVSDRSQETSRSSMELKLHKLEAESPGTNQISDSLFLLKDQPPPERVKSGPTLSESTRETSSLNSLKKSGPLLTKEVSENLLSQVRSATVLTDRGHSYSQSSLGLGGLESESLSPFTKQTSQILSSSLYDQQSQARPKSASSSLRKPEIVSVGSALQSALCLAKKKSQNLLPHPEPEASILEKGRKSSECGEDLGESSLSSSKDGSDSLSSVEHRFLSEKAKPSPQSLTGSLAQVGLTSLSILAPLLTMVPSETLLPRSQPERTPTEGEQKYIQERLVLGKVESELLSSEKQVSELSQPLTEGRLSPAGVKSATSSLTDAQFVVESQTPVYPEVSRYLRAVTSKSLRALQPPDTTFEKSKEQPIKQTTGQQISEVKSSPCIVGKKCLADGVRKTPSSLEDISEGACHKEILSTERTGTPVLVSSSDNSFKSSSNEDVPLHRYKTALVGSSSFQMMSQFSRSRSPDKESNSSLEDNVFSAESLKQAPVGSSSQFQPPTSLLQDDSRSLTGFEGSVDQDDTSVVASYPRNVLEGQNPVFPEGSRDLHTVTSKSLQALQPSDTTFENSKQQPIKQTTGQQIGEVMPPPCIVEEKCLAAGVRKTPSSLEDISGGACHKEILSTEQTGAPVLVSSSNEDVPQSCYKTALVGSSSFQIMSQFSRSRSPDKGSNSSLEDNDVSSASKGNLHEGELFPTLETREGTLVSGLDELESPSSSKEERSESSLHLFEDRPLPEGAKSVPNLLKRSQTGSLNDLISKSSLLLKAEVSQTLSSQVDPVVARAVMEQSCSQAALEHRELESESRATFSMKRSDSLSSFEDQLSSEGVKSAGTVSDRSQETSRSSMELKLHKLEAESPGTNQISDSLFLLKDQPPPERVKSGPTLSESTRETSSLNSLKKSGPLLTKEVSENLLSQVRSATVLTDRGHSYSQSSLGLGGLESESLSPFTKQTSQILSSSLYDQQSQARPKSASSSLRKPEIVSVGSALQSALCLAKKKSQNLLPHPEPEASILEKGRKSSECGEDLGESSLSSSKDGSDSLSSVEHRFLSEKAKPSPQSLTGSLAQVGLTSLSILAPLLTMVPSETLLPRSQPERTPTEGEQKYIQERLVLGKVESELLSSEKQVSELSQPLTEGRLSPAGVKSATSSLTEAQLNVYHEGTGAETLIIPSESSELLGGRFEDKEPVSRSTSISLFSNVMSGGVQSDTLSRAESLKKAPVGTSSQFRPSPSHLQDETRSPSCYEGSMDQDDMSVAASYQKELVDSQNLVFPEVGRGLSVTTSKSLKALQPLDTTFENSSEQPIKQTTGQQMKLESKSPSSSKEERSESLYLFEDRLLLEGATSVPNLLRGYQKGSSIELRSKSAPLLTAEISQSLSSHVEPVGARAGGEQCFSHAGRELGSESRATFSKKRTDSLPLLEDRLPPESVKSATTLSERSQETSTLNSPSNSASLLTEEFSQSLCSQIWPAKVIAERGQSYSHSSLGQDGFKSESISQLTMQRCQSSSSSLHDQRSQAALSSLRKLGISVSVDSALESSPCLTERQSQNFLPHPEPPASILEKQREFSEYKEDVGESSPLWSKERSDRLSLLERRFLPGKAEASPQSLLGSLAQAGLTSLSMLAPLLTKVPSERLLLRSQTARKPGEGEQKDSQDSLILGEVETESPSSGKQVFGSSLSSHEGLLSSVIAKSKPSSLTDVQVKTDDGGKITETMTLPSDFVEQISGRFESEKHVSRPFGESASSDVTTPAGNVDFGSLQSDAQSKYLIQASVDTLSQRTLATSNLEGESRSAQDSLGRVNLSEMEYKSFDTSYPKHVLESQKQVFSQVSLDPRTVTPISLPALKFPNKSSSETEIKQSVGKRIVQVKSCPCIVEDYARETPSQMMGVRDDQNYEELPARDNSVTAVNSRSLDDSFTSSSNEDVPISSYKTALIGPSSFQIPHQFFPIETSDKESTSSFEDNEFSSSSEGDLRDNESCTIVKTHENIHVETFPEVLKSAERLIHLKTVDSHQTVMLPAFTVQQTEDLSKLPLAETPRPSLSAPQRDDSERLPPRSSAEDSSSNEDVTLSSHTTVLLGSTSVRVPTQFFHIESSDKESSSSLENNEGEGEQKDSQDSLILGEVETESPSSGKQVFGSSLSSHEGLLSSVIAKSKPSSLTDVQVKTDDGGKITETMTLPSDFVEQISGRFESEKHVSRPFGESASSDVTTPAGNVDFGSLQSDAQSKYLIQASVDTLSQRTLATSNLEGESRSAQDSLGRVNLSEMEYKSFDTSYPKHVLESQKQVFSQVSLDPRTVTPISLPALKFPNKSSSETEIKQSVGKRIVQVKSCPCIVEDYARETPSQMMGVRDDQNYEELPARDNSVTAVNSRSLDDSFTSSSNEDVPISSYKTALIGPSSFQIPHQFFPIETSDKESTSSFEDNEFSSSSEGDLRDNESCTIVKTHENIHVETFPEVLKSAERLIHLKTVDSHQTVMLPAFTVQQTEDLSKLPLAETPRPSLSAPQRDDSERLPPRSSAEDSSSNEDVTLSSHTTVLLGSTSVRVPTQFFHIESSDKESSSSLENNEFSSSGEDNLRDNESCPMLETVEKLHVERSHEVLKVAGRLDHHKTLDSYQSHVLPTLTVEQTEDISRLTVADTARPSFSVPRKNDPEKALFSSSSDTSFTSSSSEDVPIRSYRTALSDPLWFQIPSHFFQIESSDKESSCLFEDNEFLSASEGSLTPKPPSIIVGRSDGDLDNFTEEWESESSLLREASTDELGTLKSSMVGARTSSSQPSTTEQIVMKPSVESTIYTPTPMSESDSSVSYPDVRSSLNTSSWPRKHEGIQQASVEESNDSSYKASLDDPWWCKTPPHFFRSRSPDKESRSYSEVTAFSSADEDDSPHKESFPKRYIQENVQKEMVIPVMKTDDEPLLPVAIMDASAVEEPGLASPNESQFAAGSSSHSFLDVDFLQQPKEADFNDSISAELYGVEKRDRTLTEVPSSMISPDLSPRTVSKVPPQRSRISKVGRKFKKLFKIGKSKNRHNELQKLEPEGDSSDFDSKTEEPPTSSHRGTGHPTSHSSVSTLRDNWPFLEVAVETTESSILQSKVIAPSGQGSISSDVASSSANLYASAIETERPAPVQSSRPRDRGILTTDDAATTQRVNEMISTIVKNARAALECKLKDEISECPCSLSDAVTIQRINEMINTIVHNARAALKYKLKDAEMSLCEQSMKSSSESSLLATEPSLSPSELQLQDISRSPSLETSFPPLLVENRESAAQEPPCSLSDAVTTQRINEMINTIVNNAQAALK